MRTLRMELSAAENELELFVAQAEQVQDRGVQVVHVNLVLDRVVAELVRRADHPNIGLILDSFHTLARKIRAGTVWVNTHNWGDAALPFGGYKQSGWGREMGKEVMEHYTETKAVGVRLV